MIKRAIHDIIFDEQSRISSPKDSPQSNEPTCERFRALLLLSKTGVRTFEQHVLHILNISSGEILADQRFGTKIDWKQKMWDQFLDGAAALPAAVNKLNALSFGNN